MRRSTNRRALRTGAVATALLLAVVGGACSSDDDDAEEKKPARSTTTKDDDKKSTTTEKDEDEEEDEDDEESTTTTEEDEDEDEDEDESTTTTDAADEVEPDEVATDDLTEGVDPWTLNASMYEGEDGKLIGYECPEDGLLGSVWGVGIYTSDSSVCTAAVHDGRITKADGGMVVIEMSPGLPSYEASSANGVESGDWGEWGASFSFVWPASAAAAAADDTGADAAG